MRNYFVSSIYSYFIITMDLQNIYSIIFQSNINNLQTALFDT